MKTVLLGDICDVVGGGTPSKANAAFYKGTIPWATVRDMNTELLRDTEFHITQNAVKKSSTNIIPKGSVIIASRVGLGKACILQQDTAINQDLRAIIPKDKEVLDTGYLFQWLKSVKNKIIEAGTGATVQGIKLPFIKSLLISLPNIKEQRRIVKKLDEVFAAIDKAKENTEKNLKNVQELFESTKSMLFIGNNNSFKKLSDIGKTQTGTTPRTTERDNYGDFIPFIKPSDFNKDGSLNYMNQGLSEKGLEKGRLIKANSFVMVCIGATIGKSGYCDRDISCNQQINALELESLEEAKFIYYQLSTRDSFEKIVRDAPQATMPIINKSKWGNLSVYMPTSEEQGRVVSILDKLSIQTQKLQKLYQQKLNDLEELRQSYLHQAFEGKL